MNEVNPIELGLACIVCIAYIWGKVWVYHKHSKDTIKRIKSGRKSRVIKRGKEWDED
jgi:hypothetical protein